MELHSYAKQRILKKWSNEQNRKLVDTRIKYDSLFQYEARTSAAPWRKIMNIAKLDDYNVFFVRRQWRSILTKYMQYKEKRLLGNLPNSTIDKKMIEVLTKEWEFFAKIHEFMTQKTTNLHSYAAAAESATTTTAISAVTTAAAISAATTNSGISTTTTTTTTTIAKEMPKQLSQEFIIENQSAQILKHSINSTINGKNEIYIDGGVVDKGDISIENQQHNNNSWKKTDIITKTAENEEKFVEIQLQQRNSSELSVTEHDYVYGSNSNENTSLNVCGSGNNKRKFHVETRNTDHDFYSKKHFFNTNVENYDSRSAPIIRVKTITKQPPMEMQLEPKYLDSITIQQQQQQQQQQQPQNQEQPLLSIKQETADILTPKSTMVTILKASESSPISSILQLPLTPSTPITTANVTSITTPISIPVTTSITTPLSTKKQQLTERDKYYRHKRRFNHRLEKRFDAVLNVVGQVVKAEYPNIDVTPILGAASASAYGWVKFFSSDDDDNNDDHDDELTDSENEFTKIGSNEDIQFC